MISIRLYQAKGKMRADGKAPIFYVLAKGSERIYILTKKYLKTDCFDNSKGLVLKGADNSIKLNAFFKRQMTRLDDIVIDLSNEGKEVTLKKVKAIFTNDLSKDFLSFAYTELKNQKHLISPKTYLGYWERLNVLKKYCNGELPFKSITYEWLALYQHDCVLKGRKPNGYYQDFATIKKFWKIAFLKGEVRHNPFNNFKLKTEETQRNWLTKEELILLNNLLLTDKITEAVKNTLRHFLFSCFTGLRFGDKKAFSNANIVNDRISLRTKKREKYINIAFNDQARELLPFVLERKLKEKSNRVTKDLKLCMESVNITKHITYHCSRHTFAVNSLLLGIDIVTVRDWLGHKSVTTTEIYAKIADQFRDENMKKWSNFYGTEEKVLEEI